MLLNTSLLREKFTITEKYKDQPPLVAVGNRILLSLQSQNSDYSEQIIVRTHSMHMALRLASEIYQEFRTKGPILNRQTPFPWKNVWYDLSTDFERPHTPETWCSVYNNGRLIYQDGVHHPFLDIIEQCDIKNRAEYDRAIPIAIDIFKQAGKNVDIKHEVNIAAVVGAMTEQVRCGLILRAPLQTSTFNFTIKQKTPENNTIIPANDGLDLCAYYLEAIQLAVTAGFNEGKMLTGQLKETTNQARKTKASYTRIGRLNNTIETIESLYDIRYRPEKPDFQNLLDIAKRDVVTRFEK